MRAARPFPTWARRKVDPLRLTAVLLPPLAVRSCGRADLIPLSVLLTFLGWVPGIVHAWTLVSRTAHQREQLFVSAFRNHLRH